MKNTGSRILSTILLTLFVPLVGAGFIRSARAQSPELQQRVAEIKEAMAHNKQTLASYSWNELITISLKGEQKKQEHFQVRLGPDGKAQKVSLDAPPAPPSGGRMKQHVVEKKKEEYKDYADAMKALTEQYVPPSGELLEQAYAKGNITLGTVPGTPSAIQLVIHNYLKPQDSMTLVFDRTEKALLGLQIATYMDDPKDAMTLTVRFARLPDGTNHVDGVVMDGVSKQLNIATQNSNYSHV
jgi:hypothetical protein